MILDLRGRRPVSRQSRRPDAAAALDELLALDLERDVVVHVVDAALQQFYHAEEARHHACVEIVASPSTPSTQHAPDALVDFHTAPSQ